MVRTRPLSETIEGENPLKSYKRQRIGGITEASFHEFRVYTVEKYPNLAWLGPASIAVYWYRTYLKEDWIRCNAKDEKKKNNKRRRRGGNFCHIPGDYCTNNHQLIADDILQLGMAGVHYANSYIGLYNMIRRYGSFSRCEDGEIHLTGYECPKLPVQ
jgi:hypothetical protein